MKTCLECGTPFIQKTRKPKRFCSKKCYQRKQKREAYVPTGAEKGRFVSCSYCHQQFWARPSHIKRTKGTMFCSQEHNTLYMKERAHRLNCVVCGMEFYCQPCQVKYRNRKTCSVDCRAKLQTQIAEYRRVTQPPSRAALDRRIRYSKRMDDWRKAVFERDDYTCQICAKRGGVLNADHIKPFALYPELRFELSNGRTLCRPCHMKTDTWGYNKELYGKKETSSPICA